MASSVALRVVKPSHRDLGFHWVITGGAKGTSAYLSKGTGRTPACGASTDTGLDQWYCLELRPTCCLWDT